MARVAATPNATGLFRGGALLVVRSLFDTLSLWAVGLVDGKPSPPADNLGELP